MKAINSRPIAVVRYGAVITKWKKEELRRARPRKGGQADIDRLYLPREKGGKGMINVENCVQMEIKSLGMYIEGSSERLLNVVEDDNYWGWGNQRKIFKR